MGEQFQSTQRGMVYFRWEEDLITNLLTLFKTGRTLITPKQTIESRLYLENEHNRNILRNNIITTSAVVIGNPSAFPVTELKIAHFHEVDYIIRGIRPNTQCTQGSFELGFGPEEIYHRIHGMVLPYSDFFEDNGDYKGSETQTRDILEFLADSYRPLADAYYEWLSAKSLIEQKNMFMFHRTQGYRFLTFGATVKQEKTPTLLCTYVQDNNDHTLVGIDNKNYEITPRTVPYP